MVGITALVVPFCVTMGSDAVLLPSEAASVVVLSVHDGACVGDASVAVTRTVGRLRLLIRSEGTMELGSTVTLPAASVAEKISPV